MAIYSKINQYTYRLQCQAGTGGDGDISFFQGDKWPDGGNGGRGGNIYLQASEKVINLSNINLPNSLDLKGHHGSLHHRKGSKAEDFYIHVPMNTQIYQIVGESKVLIGEVSKKDPLFLLCRGGKGGRGNYAEPKTEVREHNKGEEGEIADVILRQTLKADVAIIGHTNSQKSTLFNYLIGQNLSKVDFYPHATQSIIWGTLMPEDLKKKHIVIIDTPSPSKKDDLSFYDDIVFRAVLVIVIRTSKEKINLTKLMNIIGKDKKVLLFDNFDNATPPEEKTDYYIAGSYSEEIAERIKSMIINQIS